MVVIIELGECYLHCHIQTGSKTQSTSHSMGTNMYLRNALGLSLFVVWYQING
jgi:hypothetical protein